MSAFILSDKAIETIVQALEIANEEGRRFSCGFPSLEYLESDILQASLNVSPKHLAQKMLVLNYIAVDARYDNGDSDFIPKVTYKPDYFDRPEPIQVYKYLESFLYQCSEGSVPESNLYKALDEYKKALACHMVAKSPEYLNANWS